MVFFQLLDTVDDALFDYAKRIEKMITSINDHELPMLESLESLEGIIDRMKMEYKLLE